LQDFEVNQPTVTIIGLGFVGLPLAIKLVEKNLNVIGIDVDKRKISQLLNGESYIPDISSSQLQGAFKSKQFSVSSDYRNITTTNAVIICVPTPLTTHQTPDLSYVTAAANSITPYLQENQLVVLESSTYPGTTREVRLPILENSGKKVGENIYLGYSPERIDPGNQTIPIDEVPKIISGITSGCLEKMLDLYKMIYINVVPVSSTETAEITKLLENTYRFINISFINEFATICDSLGVDVWEVIDAAKTKPYGFTAFYPGPGIGGHCIPVDPFYLQWKISNYEMSSLFITAASTINKTILQHIIAKIKEILQKPMNESSILLYGMTYKKDISDIRDSQSVELFKCLLDINRSVLYHDPYVSTIKIDSKIFNSTPLTQETLGQVDCVVILTDHSEIPLDTILEHSFLVFDTRNVVKDQKGNATIIKLGGGRP